MAKQVKLKAEPRPTVGRSAVRKLRARGLIPAVIYGGTDKPQPLDVMNVLAGGDPAAPFADVLTANRTPVARVGPGTGGNAALTRIDSALEKASGG